MRCSEVREVLPAYLKDGDVSLAVRRHLSRCDECTTELARYEALMNGLGSLEVVASEPPPELRAQLIAIPQRDRVAAVRHHVTRNRHAYVGGAAVALAGAVGAALWAGRRRRVATA